MCNPIAMLVTQTGLSMLQTRNETNAQAGMYYAQAKQAEINKQISDRKQEQIAEQYLQERERMNRTMRLAAGQQAAQIGASGLTLNGSGLDVLSASYDGFQKDVQSWENNKNNAIYSEMLNGINFTNQANAANAAASNAKRQGKLKMISTLIGAASSYKSLKAQYATSQNQSDTISNTAPTNPYVWQPNWPTWKPSWNPFTMKENPYLKRGGK